jgi:D-beta-D-heptose 7-phosphate kinase/D-beta-D-heptose 1-phosphate adenosyltransferase
MELPEIKRTRILVVGEAVLDRYLWGETERISPEAPIPVLRVSRCDERPGNAAFVCANLVALGAHPAVLSVVGIDYAGGRLRQMLTGCGVDTNGLIEDPSRPTILKERLLGSVQSAHRATQQLLRVDHEDPRVLSDAVESRLLNILEAELDRADGVLVCDIAKGILSERLLRAVIDGAGRRGKLTLVDPRRTENYSIYRGASALTPNRYETEQATGLTMNNSAAWECAARKLIDQYDLSNCLVTLDRDGMFVAERGGAGVHIETTPREVYDVTGAGDVVLSVFGLLMINGVEVSLAASLANLGAGLEVAKQGAATISRDELAQALLQASRGANRKVLGSDELIREIRRHRDAGKRVCFVHGRFQPLRGFHIRLFESARRHGEVLVVGIDNRGASYGTHFRNPETCVLVAGLEAVDYVVPFHNDDSEEIVAAIRPDIVLNEDRPTFVFSSGTDSANDPTVNGLDDKLAAE